MVWTSTEPVKVEVNLLHWFAHCGTSNRKCSFAYFIYIFLTNFFSAYLGRYCLEKQLNYKNRSRSLMPHNDAVDALYSQNSLEVCFPFRISIKVPSCGPLSYILSSCSTEAAILSHCADPESCQGLILYLGAFVPSFASVE